MALYNNRHIDRIKRGIEVFLVLSSLLAASIPTDIYHNEGSKNRLSLQYSDPVFDSKANEFRHNPESNLAGVLKEDIRDLRTSNTKFYCSARGKQTARSWSKPIHWMDEKGEYRDYLTDIIETEDTQFSLGCDENSIRAGFSATSFPDRPMVMVEVGGEKITSTQHYMEVVSGSEKKKIDPGVVRGDVSGNRIIYGNIYPGIDERYLVQPDKLKNEYLLKERPAFLKERVWGPDSYLTIYMKLEFTSGIEMIKPSLGKMREWTSAREIILTLKNDEKGGLVRIPTPVIYDSSPSRGLVSHDPGKRTFSDYIIHPLRKEDGKGILLGTRVPLSFLLRNDIAYPVIIDPTIERIQPGPSAGKDNFLVGISNHLTYGDCRDDNSGGDVYFQLNVESTAPLRPMLQFNLSSLPPDSVVEEAQLNIKMNDHFAGGGDIDTMLYRVTHDWVEGTGDFYQGTLTQDGACWLSYDGTNGWTAGGEYDFNEISSIKVGSDRWYKFEIADLVGGWISGVHTNYGLLLKGMSGTPGWKLFASSDYPILSERPYLEISYGIRPIIESVNISPRTSIKGDTCHINSTCFDPDGTITEYQWISSLDGLFGWAREFNISTLSPGTHQINFVVRDNDGYSTNSDCGEIIILDPPPPPVLNFSAYDTADDQGGSVTISWDYGYVYDLDHFNIYITDTEYLGNLSHRFPEAQISDTNVRMANISTIGGLPLVDGNEYFLGIVAVDDLDNHLFEISGTETAIPLDNLCPPPVMGIDAVDLRNDQGGSILVSWTPLSLVINQQGPNYFYHYNIYIEDHPFTKLEGLSPEVDDLRDHRVSEFILQTAGSKPLVDLVDYYVAVTARDFSANEVETVSCFGPVQARDNLPPSSVRNLASRDRPHDEGGAVILEWTENSEQDVHHYNLYMSETDFSSVEGLQPIDVVEKTGEGSLRHILEGLANDLYYYFAVTAVDEEGNEFHTIKETVRTKASDDLAPGAISSFTAEDTPLDNGASITLHWNTCTAPDFKQYILYGTYLDPITEVEGMTPLMFISSSDTQTMLVLDMDGEKIHDNRNYYFGICVEDLNGNINSTMGLAGPVKSMDNLAPRILNISHSKTTIFNRSLDLSTGEMSSDGGGSWFNASFELEKNGDEVSIGWLLDGRNIGNNQSLSIDIFSISQGHHTLRLELIDPPFHISEDINFTVIETSFRSKDDGKNSQNNFIMFIGLIGLAALLLGMLVYLLVIRPPRRKKKEEIDISVKGPREMELAKIHIKKKVVAIGARNGRRKTRKNVDVKNRLYYLEDNVGKQFALKKKHYKPDKVGPCPMKDLPRSDFACPESVVGKCGLSCSQKTELDIPQPANKKAGSKPKKSRKELSPGKSVQRKTGKKGKGPSKKARKRNPSKLRKDSREKKRSSGNTTHGQTKPSPEKSSNQKEKDLIKHGKPGD